MVVIDRFHCTIQPDYHNKQTQYTPPGLGGRTAVLWYFPNAHELKLCEIKFRYEKRWSGHVLANQTIVFNLCELNPCKCFWTYVIHYCVYVCVCVCVVCVWCCVWSVCVWPLTHMCEALSCGLNVVKLIEMNDPDRQSFTSFNMGVNNNNLL